MSKQSTQETPEQVPPEQPEAAEPVEQPQAPPDGESATADEILQTEYEEAKKLVRQLTPEERERLRQLSQDYIKELSSPIIAGEWDVTYVRCRYVQYYLITPVEFQVAVLENPDEVDIRLYGSKVTVSLNDIVGPRVGWLPHLLHPEGLPVFLLTSSPWMNHRAITAEEVVKKFTREDLEKIGDAVEAYQTRKVGALLVDYARDLKAWKETANRRGLSHYEQSLSILQVLLLWESIWGDDFGRAGGFPWYRRITTYVKKHKRGVGLAALGIGVVIALVIALVFLRITLPLPTP